MSKMKQMNMLMIVLLLCSMSFPVASGGGSITGADVYSLANYNCYLTDLGYDYETRTLFFVAKQDTWINESVGLGLFIMKFKLTRAPDFRNVSATINGIPAKDMIKNVTFADGSVMVIDENGTSRIKDCKYLQIFFFIFENHTIINEQPIDVNIGPLWDDNDYIHAQTLAESLPSVKITISSNITELEEEEMIQKETSTPLLIIISSGGLIAIVAGYLKRNSRK